jgi:hypothetical protein
MKEIKIKNQKSAVDLIEEWSPLLTIGIDGPLEYARIS